MTKTARTNSPYARTFADYLHYTRTVVYKEPLRKFVKRIDLSPGYIGRLEQGLASVPRRDTVVQIAEGLGQDPDIWLAKAGYVPSSDLPNPELEFAVLKLQRLTEEQLETVLTMVDALALRNERGNDSND